uniref:Olfactory receptor n=1 Tax=Pyxicephalus adspersus TaxID=30357 RepID=A0AAV3B3V3_PYXAD|nr:TPA: hypothetical protein GDO54_006223 [Pyxicephalus adspersus]
MKNILEANHTFNTDFYILAFGKSGVTDFVLFSIFLLLYLICLTWNSVIIALINSDTHLQTPMFFFLSNLSLVDISYTSVTVPKLLDIFLTGNNRISSKDCFSQFFFFTGMACTEIFLLTAMSYDRYVAICKSLHYPLLMKKRNCNFIVAGSWASAYSTSLFVTTVASNIPFCGLKVIDQLYCDIKPMLKISCGNTLPFQVVVYFETFLMGICPFVSITLSYIKIISTILAVHRKGKRKKAFSTCTSHLTVIAIFYGTIFFVYMVPTSADFRNVNQIFSALFLVVIPTLNPLIYSLRNNDIKCALRKKCNMLFKSY